MDPPRTLSKSTEEEGVVTSDHPAVCMKQWSGLLRDVYIPRAELYRKQALHDAAADSTFDAAAVAESYAHQVFKWQTQFEYTYPTDPVGDPVAVSAALRRKWAAFFGACP